MRGRSACSQAEPCRLQAIGELMVPGAGEYEEASIVRIGEYREHSRVVSEPGMASYGTRTVCPCTPAEPPVHSRAPGLCQRERPAASPALLPGTWQQRWLVAAAHPLPPCKPAAATRALCSLQLACARLGPRKVAHLCPHGRSQLCAGLVQAQAGLPWRKRLPRWLVVERVTIFATWRASQACFRPWTGPGCLQLAPAAVDATSKACPKLRQPAPGARGCTCSPGSWQPAWPRWPHAGCLRRAPAATGCVPGTGLPCKSPYAARAWSRVRGAQPVPRRCLQLLTERGLQELVAALVDLSVHSYRHVRASAIAHISTALKRLPLLAPGVMPAYLGILASQPAADPAQAWQDPDAALQVRLLQCALQRGQRQSRRAQQCLAEKHAHAWQPVSASGPCGLSERMPRAPAEAAPLTHRTCWSALCQLWARWQHLRMTSPLQASMLHEVSGRSMHCACCSVRSAACSACDQLARNANICPASFTMPLAARQHLTVGSSWPSPSSRPCLHHGPPMHATLRVLPHVACSRALVAVQRRALQLPGWRGPPLCCVTCPCTASCAGSPWHWQPTWQPSWPPAAAWRPRCCHCARPCPACCRGTQLPALVPCPAMLADGRLADPAACAGARCHCRRLLSPAEQVPAATEPALAAGQAVCRLHACPWQGSMHLPPQQRPLLPRQRLPPAWPAVPVQPSSRAQGCHQAGRHLMGRLAVRRRDKAACRRQSLRWLIACSRSRRRMQCPQTAGASWSACTGATP